MEATVHGCRLFYRLHKKEADGSPTILLLHGWGCDSSMFSFIESDLSAKASVLSLDFPGHGRSGQPPEPWGVAEYSQQLYDLLKELSIDRVHVIAHSFGGRVAIYLASTYPDLIDKLVITGGAGIKKPLSDAQLKRQQDFKRYNAALNSMKRIALLASPVNKLQASLRNRYGSADYIKLNEVMRQSFSKIVSLDLYPNLKDIHSSTLLIWGSADTETPLWMGQQMEKEIPDAGLIIFEGRTHFAFVEEWQRFLLIVKEFFFGGSNT